MRADNDRIDLETEGAQESAEDIQEENLSWLLDMDREDPEEKLFALGDDEYQESGLTEYESELAARPLTSAGKPGADDLSMFVEEEIVVSSDYQNSNIYDAPAARNGDATEQSSDEPESDAVKAIDHSRKGNTATSTPHAGVEDGCDILGLAEDDDMGETYLTIRRVKSPGPRKKKTGPDKGGQQPCDNTGSRVSAAAAPEDTLAAPVPGPAVEDPAALSSADISSQGADLSADAVDAEGSGWLSQEALKLDSVVADSDEIPSLVEDGTGPIEGIAAYETDLAALGATLAEESTEQEQSDDWLVDVELELVATDTPDEDQQPAAADVEADDWLAAVELSQVVEEEQAGGDDAAELIQVEAPSQDSDLPSLAAAQESVELIQMETDLLLEEFAEEQRQSDGPGDESGEWLGSSDLELYEMVDSDAVDTGWPGVENVSDEIGIGAESAGDESAREPVQLSEAPITGLVAEPGEHTVANEEGESLEVAAAGDDVGDNVLAYVAQHKPPVNDEEFDEYLLRGAHLADNVPDPDELEVERTEGIVSVDPGTEIDIDYHDDFRAMEGFDGGSLTAITAVIADVMEQVSALARSRMDELGLDADNIDVDVMLGSDAESIEQCQARGYEQISVICSEQPAALAGLDQAGIDAIYVRLFNPKTNDNRNDLFQSGQPQEEAVEQQAVQAEQADGFGDELLGGDFMDELGDATLPGVSADIDSMFDELAVEGEPAAVDQEPELPVDVAMEFAEFEDAVAQETPAEADTEAAQEPDLSSDGDGGFDEDIFNAELGSDFDRLAGDEAGEQAADIDVVFAGLGMGESDSDEICGVDVGEFEQAEDVEVLEAAAEYAGSSGARKTASGDDMSWCIPGGIAFNYTSQSGNEIFADFLDAFIEEGAATLEKLEDATGEWERDVESDASFAEMGRILHTLKGIAKGVGLQRYGTLIHNFETLLEHLDRPAAGAADEYFRIVHAWLDASVRGLEFVRENRVDIASEFPASAEQETVPGAEPEPAPEPEQSAAEDAAAAEDDISRQMVSDRVAARQKKRDQQLADEGAKALAAQQSVRITSEKLDHLLNLTNQAQQLGVRSAQSTNRSKRASAELQGRLSSVRTHIARIADRALLNVNARAGQQPTSELDALEMDQYSELQEAANILREAVEDLSDLVDVSSRHTAVLEALLKQQATVISTIGSSIQAARVVPVSRLMPGLRRIVRTVSADLDKSVAFKVLNETGALDRDHYARCQVILEHMVRNALDHGIESPEERLAAGKATTGRITIDVRKSGGDYYITLTDDGRGIDPYEVRESAFRKGLDIDVDALSDEEAIQLIFHKGFSTASTLSEISGRGVGMDIVLSELQQIGGDVKVHSTVGLGTTFEVHVPANVTVNGALLVTVGDNSYAIPLNGLVAVEHVPVADFFRAVECNELLKLSDIECEPAYLATLCHGQSLPDRSTWGDSVPVIIAGSEKRYMAIAIDNVEEALELVIRSLGPQFANVPGVAGGATTADGEAIVALDLNMLVESVAAGELSAVAVDHTTDNTLLALVVDDSRTQRMVATSQFDTVGVETITAENGLVAIDLLNTTHRLPDVVLLDVEMPVKDGIETLREIRKSQRYRHLPVIMVTSRTGAKHRALAEEAGCDGYMGKPFNFAGLIEQINELTGSNLQVS